MHFQIIKNKSEDFHNGMIMKTDIPNLWATGKGGLRGEQEALSVYIGKTNK